MRLAERRRGGAAASDVEEAEGPAPALMRALLGAATPALAGRSHSDMIVDFTKQLTPSR